jgi:cytoskeletal protein RodZ
MKSERGNIIVYLLVGVVLFGLLLGGLWWVKARVADKPSAPVATTNEQNKPTTETEVNQDGTQETKPSEETTTEAEATPSTPAVPAPTSPAPTPAAVTPAPTASALPPESQTPRTGPSPSNVAASGPLENALGTSFGLGVLAYLGTSFVRSRRTTH